MYKTLCAGQYWGKTWCAGREWGQNIVCGVGMGTKHCVRGGIGEKHGVRDGNGVKPLCAGRYWRQNIVCGAVFGTKHGVRDGNGVKTLCAGWDINLDKTLCAVREWARLLVPCSSLLHCCVSTVDRSSRETSRNLLAGRALQRFVRGANIAHSSDCR